MEKRGRANAALANAAAALDLPADLVAGLPRLELTGGRELLVERHKGILAYSAELIDINAGELLVRIRGKGLELLCMTAEELRVGGEIAAVELLR